VAIATCRRACSVDRQCVLRVDAAEGTLGASGQCWRRNRGYTGTSRYAISSLKLPGERWGVRWYVRGYTVYRGEKVLFQDSQNLGSQGSLDMYTLHEVNTKVITLSDICSADGTYILPQAKAGSPLPYRTSTLDWPNQGKPLPADWATWRHSLAYLEERGKLQTPLGAWIHKSHQQWQTFYDPANTQLFLQETPGQINVIQQALRNTSRRTRSSIKPVYDMSKQQRADPPLSSTVPATIRHDPYCYPYVYIDYSPNTLPSTVSEDPPPASTFPRHIKRLLGTGNHITAIKEAILANSLLVTTDGSYDPVTTNASYSWVFNYQGVDIHTGSSQITSSNRNAYRTELLGILAALTIVQHIELMHPE